MKAGEKIAKAAKSKGMNLHQLAIKADVPYNTLYAIVRRKSGKIDTSIIKRLADALDVHYFDLYNDEDVDLIKTGVDIGIKFKDYSRDAFTRLQFMSEFQEQGYSFEPGETRLVRAYNRLNDIGQAQILLLTEGMAEMPRFMLDPPEDGAQPSQNAPATPSEGTDTTPRESPSEGTGEGTENK